MPRPSTPQDQVPQNARLRCVLQPSALSLALALGAALAPAAQAVTVYDESVGGDVRGDQNSPTVLGSLQSGLNTFIGYDSKATDILGTGQGDSLAVTLGNGQRLSAVSFTATDYTGSDAYVVTFFRVATTSPPYSFHVYGRTAQLSGNQTIQFNIPAGLSNESLGFSVQLATTNDPSTGFNWHWDVQTTTSPVPEPAAAGLLLAGLAGLGMVLGQQRRRGQAGAAG